MTNELTLRPLCIDLDKTLVREDVFRSALLSWILRGCRPWTSFPPLNRDGFKRWLYRNISLGTIEWHFNLEVISLICQARKSLRPVILVTGNSEEAGNFFGEKIPCFTSILTSTEKFTLKGKRKAIELQTLFGVNNFDYVGDSKIDTPVWKVCNQAYILTYPHRSYRKIMKQFQGVKPIPIFLNSSEANSERLTSSLVSKNRKGFAVGCSCLK